jgi:hypothetical protein
MRRPLLGIALFAIGCCTLVGCNICSDDVLSRSTSPDGALVATLFQRDCGATTDYSTIVNVGGPSDSFKGEKGRVFVVKGQKHVTVKWTDNRALVIECDSCSRSTVFRQVTALGDIDIAYSLPPAAAGKPKG